MSETSTTAMLVGSKEMFETRPAVLTTTLPRGEIETALQSDPPAELVLEIVRSSDAADADRHNVSIAWSREDLASLLEDASAEAYTFSFDPAELQEAIEGSDVEGHGLREVAAALSIAAVAAAGAGAAGAAAAPLEEASLGQQGIGVQAAAVAHDEATLAERGIGIQLSSSHDEATLAERGIDSGRVAAIHDEATLASRGIQPGTLPAVHDEATLAARGIEPGTLPAIHDEATLTARGIQPADPIVVADTGSGFDMPSVEPGTVAALAGGAAAVGLLIAGAAFATRRREPGTV